MAPRKSEFRNTTEGHIGVVVIENGNERGIGVRPGDSIWLSEDEQIATANAPRRDEDNPFINGQLELVTAAQEIANRRPIGSSEAPQVPEKKPSSRAKQDKERAEKEAERQEKAKKQAEAGPLPAEETGAAVSPSGNPKVGKRSQGEEVATPEAAAKA